LTPKGNLKCNSNAIPIVLRLRCCIGFPQIQEKLFFTKPTNVDQQMSTWQPSGTLKVFILSSGGVFINAKLVDGTKRVEEEGITVAVVG
jgi:hypothetical protein